MNDAVTTALREVGDLLLPRRCAACDMPLMRRERGICLPCHEDLPRTWFHDDPGNPVERAFHGRVLLEAASAFTHFDAQGRVRRILHRLKYKGDQAAGLELGRLMALDLRNSTRFASVDAIMAVPLHRRKLARRGYNQCDVLVDGMREVLPWEPIRQGLMRVVRTPSQTRKGRIDRWRNMQEAFHLSDPGKLANTHILLVDDVITTGATLESCVLALAAVPGIRISVFTAACA